MLAIVAVLVTGCGGAGSDQATARTCAVMADVEGRVLRLAATRPADLDAAQVQGQLASMAVRLGELREAAAELDEEQAQRVQEAERAFGSQLAALLDSLLLSGEVGAEGVEADLAEGLTQLRDAYGDSLGGVGSGMCADDAGEE